MIAMAQQFIEQAQHEAEAQAREMTVAAQERAREIVNEARSRAEDEVTRLNGLKQRLSEDVATLTRQLDAERTRLTGVLSELSKWIESSLHMGASASPRASASPTTTGPEAAAMTTPEAPRPLSPPPAPPATIGQVLNFEPPSDDRS
jgi:vacuolar-type H+-ATPase subunit H